ncbi:MAG: hypothetical protein HY812_03860 [Planctomycetes bacterium]|nr:hypothetical protein [Planctomycetota bacterium]
MKWLLREDGRSSEERARLVRLLLVLAELPPPPDPYGLFPRYARLKERLLHAGEGLDGEALEEAFLELYCHLHGHEAPYTAAERRRVNETGGYWCHAGGISPILLAGPFLGAETVLADFGAGNGLQGLFMQVLHPHRRTVQIEISSRMIAAGRELQAWLGIGAERVLWVEGDVLDHSPRGFDFIYLYRPVRPEGEGRRFYERFGRELAASQDPVVIFSVADCLGPFLPEGFQVIHHDGHLTCYRRC